MYLRDSMTPAWNLDLFYAVVQHKGVRFSLDNQAHRYDENKRPNSDRIDAKEM